MGYFSSEAAMTLVDRCLAIEEAFRRVGAVEEASQLVAVRVRLESGMKWFSARPPPPPEDADLVRLISEAQRFLRDGDTLS